MFLPGFALTSTGSALALFVLSSRVAARLETPDETVPVDDDDVAKMSDSTGADRHALYDAGDYPTAQAEPAPGAFVVQFTGDANLQIASPGGIIAELLLVIPPGATGTIFARDTDAATTLPAIVVDIIEEV